MTARYASLAAFLVLVLAASYLAGSFEAGTWYYEKLTKPFWTPTGMLWGVAWAMAWVLLAAAAWQLWLTGHYARPGALLWWLLLLVLLVAWSSLFYGLHRIGWAWFELTAALGVAALCYRAFLPLSVTAARLLLPVLLWLLYVWALNFVLWSTNGGPLAFLIAD